jgi:diguanylate cyclase (GGDEF)-like protein
MRITSGQWILLQLVLLAVAFNIARAAPPVTLVLEDKPAYDLSGYLEILTDPTGKLTAREAAGRTDWSGPVRERVPNLGFTQSAIWLRFSLSNRADTPRKFYISFEYPVTNSVTFYHEGPRGAFEEMRAGSSVPASGHIIPDRHFLFPLTLGADKTVAVYLRVQSTSGMTLPIRILSDQGLSRKAIRDYTIYGALFGLLILVQVYFMAMSSSLYKGTGLWLSLYSILFGLHTAVRGGFLRLIIPDTLTGIYSILQLLIIGGLYFTGAKFFRAFLSLKNHSKSLDLIMMAFQYLSILFVVLALFQSPLITVISLILIVINPIFSICLAFYFWRKGVANAGYFAIGWIVAHSVSVYDFFRINGALPYPVFGEWLIPFSFLVAFLFLSVALIRQNAADHLLAGTDPLTRLANRRKFDEALNDEWNRCRRLGSPLSLIMADVDNFKNYNDSFGHRAGDQCLCRIADVLGQYTRRTGDLAVRYGGEEFVLLLPNLDAAGAFTLAETIRNAIGQAAQDGESLCSSEKMTISIGVATTVPAEGKTPENLIMEADKALYEAKRAGKNRTVACTANTI